MNRIIDHPNFFIIELSCIVLAVILWASTPTLSWLALLVAVAPLLLRLVARKPVFTRTPFDLPILLFLLTAGMGVWAAYQPQAAWMKFWFLIAAALFYYLLSRQPVENLWKAVVLLSLLGLGISIYFFLSNDWEAQPQKVFVISQLGEAWMRIRPDINLVNVNPNDIAGIADITFAFSFTLILRFWRKKSYVWGSLFIVFTAIIGITILFTQSRGAWLALGITAGLILLWWILNRWLVKRTLAFRKALYAAIIVLVGFAAIGYTWLSLHQKLIQVAVGSSDTFVLDSRFHLFWSAIELIRDTPFTGGGLESFPGLYSSYILNNPNYILGYSHNIFLDAAVQQGVLGGLMLCWILLGSLVLLVSKPLTGDHSILRYSILASLLIMILHGLVDNIVLRTIFTMLLLFVPGMAVGLLTSTRLAPEKVLQANIQKRKLVIPGLIAFIVVLSAATIFQRPLLSAWYTDLGAVEMAKVQLADFPTGTWDDGQNVGQLSPAEALFNRAIDYEPENPGANYRLGLIAMLKKNFPAAVSHLEIANLGDPYHRGVIKTLGFSYLWNGQIEAAQPLLSLLPETSQEVGVYTWWWGQQNRPDLTAYANQYLQLVGAGR